MEGRSIEAVKGSHTTWPQVVKLTISHDSNHTTTSISHITWQLINTLSNWLLCSWSMPMAAGQQVVVDQEEVEAHEGHATHQAGHCRAEQHT